VSAERHEVCVRFNRRQRVRDRDGDAAHLEKRAIVLGIPDTNRLGGRNAELVERARQTRRFRHVRRQCHHGIFVEHDLPRQLQCANRVANRPLVRLHGGDDGVTDRERDRATCQPVDQFGRSGRP